MLRVFRCKKSLRMPQNMFLKGFKWKSNISKFDKDFQKNDNEDRNKGYIFEVDVEYLENFIFMMIFHFISDRVKINKCKQFFWHIN